MNDRTRPEWIELGLAVATLLLAVATFAVAFYARRSASDSAKAIAAYLDSVDIPPSVSTVIIDDAYVAPGGEGRLTLYQSHRRRN